jgi:hypothetical protein
MRPSSAGWTEEPGSWVDGINVSAEFRASSFGEKTDRYE